MPKSLRAEDVFPLVDCLSTRERLRLLRLISTRPFADDRDAYRALPPRDEEFSSEDEPLAWDAEGWARLAHNKVVRFRAGYAQHRPEPWFPSLPNK
jgi:hypothetical protein